MQKGLRILLDEGRYADWFDEHTMVVEDEMLCESTSAVIETRGRGRLRRPFCPEHGGPPPYALERQGAHIPVVA